MNHVEADTAIFTIHNDSGENGWEETVVIDAEDTNIYAQPAYVLQKVSGELLIENKNIYVVIAELCLPLQWLILFYKYMLWLVVITTVVSMDMEKKQSKKIWKAPKQEFCFISVVTYFQFRPMYWTILKHFWSNMFMGVRRWYVQRHGPHSVKNEKEEHANINARWRYILIFDSYWLIFDYVQTILQTAKRTFTSVVISLHPANTRRPGDVPWRSPKGPNVRDLQGTFRGLLGNQQKKWWFNEKSVF